MSDLAKKQGGTLVIDKSGPTLIGIPSVVYSDPGYDITDAVVKEVNKDRPAPVVAAPAASATTPAAAAPKPAAPAAETAAPFTVPNVGTKPDATKKP